MLFIIARSRIFPAPYVGQPAELPSRRASGHRVTNPTTDSNRGAAAASSARTVPAPLCPVPQGGSTSSWVALPSSSHRAKAVLGFKAVGVPGALSRPQAPQYCLGLALTGEHRDPRSLLAPLTAGSGSLALHLSTNKLHQPSLFVK